MASKSDMDAYGCSICLEILFEPITMPCNHKMCKPCFAKNLELTNLHCPFCKKRIGTWCRKAKNLDNLVDKPNKLLLKLGAPRPMNHSLPQCNPAVNTCTKTYIFSLCMSLIAWSTALAEVRLPRFFADNMVLQQNQTNTIWGWADPGEEVVVRASWKAITSTVTDSEGRWKVFLKRMLDLQ